jgi:hypothetical protein
MEQGAARSLLRCQMRHNNGLGRFLQDDGPYSQLSTHVGGNKFANKWTSRLAALRAYRLMFHNPNPICR